MSFLTSTRKTSVSSADQLSPRVNRAMLIPFRLLVVASWDQRPVNVSFIAQAYSERDQTPIYIRPNSEVREHTYLLHLLISRPPIHRPLIYDLSNIDITRAFHDLLDGYCRIQRDAKLAASLQHQDSPLFKIRTLQCIVITTRRWDNILDFQIPPRIGVTVKDFINQFLCVLERGDERMNLVLLETLF